MANISTEGTKAIRAALKKAFPQYKFSVRNNSFTRADVAVMAGPAFDIIEGIDRKQLDMNRGEVQICNNPAGRYGKYSELFSKILEIIKTAPYLAGVGDLWHDKSEAQLDHFDTAYYINLSVGRWDKPYTAT